MKYLLHECFENTKFIPPGRIKFLAGDLFWKYDISNGNSSFHFPSQSLNNRIILILNVNYIKVLHSNNNHTCYSKKKKGKYSPNKCKISRIT